MYQMRIEYHSDLEGRHNCIFATEPRIETLRKRLIDHLRLPDQYWGFSQKAKIWITRAGYPDIVERVFVIDYCRAIGIYLYSDNGVS